MNKRLSTYLFSLSRRKTGRNAARQSQQCVAVVARRHVRRQRQSSRWPLDTPRPVAAAAPCGGHARLPRNTISQQQPSAAPPSSPQIRPQREHLECGAWSFVVYIYSSNLFTCVLLTAVINI